VRAAIAPVLVVFVSRCHGLDARAHAGADAMQGFQAVLDVGVALGTGHDFIEDLEQELGALFELAEPALETAAAGPVVFDINGLGLFVGGFGFGGGLLLFCVDLDFAVGGGGELGDLDGASFEEGLLAYGIPACL
jgi:hypothetical protein